MPTRSVVTSFTADPHSALVSAGDTGLSDCWRRLRRLSRKSGAPLKRLPSRNFSVCDPWRTALVYDRRVPCRGRGGEDGRRGTHRDPSVLDRIPSTSPVPDRPRRSDVGDGPRVCLAEIPTRDPSHARSRGHYSRRLLLLETEQTIPHPRKPIVFIQVSEVAKGTIT